MIPKMQGAIAAGHEKTAAAGREMFTLGGNAFDAAVAAMLASFVVEPVLTSAAGGGFFLAHTHDDRNLLFDFFSQTPRRKKPLSDLDFYPIELDFGDETQIFHVGLGSMAVPGNIAGVFEVHQQLGKLPFHVVVEPAIHYAQNGVELSNFSSFCLNLLKPIFLSNSETKKIAAPNGKFLQAGELLVMKDFAATLTELANRGVKEFYQGEIAHQLVKDCQDKGGYLTLEDLQNYRVIVRQPLQINYRSRVLLTNPPPSSGGILIAFALKLLNNFNLPQIEFGCQEHLQILAEVMRVTNLARKKGCDPYIDRADIAEIFLGDEQINSYQQELNKLGSTTQISTIDSEGNAASVTTSNGEGSAYVIPGTGIMVNNMLGEADLNPHGFHQWECDRRISSMMSPTIVLNEGKPEIVLGSGGSNRIRTAILQVISNLIDYQMSLEAAVSSPRVHWENNIFSVEPPLLAEIVKNLAFGEETELVFWQNKNMFFGGVHAVKMTADGEIEGAGDRRREGFWLKS
ncbi:MAG: gamma-glutamyltransferase [Kamptonema sp. SIO1D9]|nr:gamma-glutamyltransferase [Kamptonema sp. SIO1D9]